MTATLSFVEPNAAAGDSDIASGARVRSLEAPLDLAEAGGKAHALGRIHALGIPVPAGVVILRRVFEEWLDESGLRAEIDRTLKGAGLSDPAALDAASNAIRELI